MPNKVRIIQKEWVVLTRPYMMYQDSAVVISPIQVKHPCQSSGAPCPQYSNVENGNNAWTEYKRAKSFAEIRKAVRELLYEVGLKRDDIQIVEIIDHDYIIAPLT